MPPEFQSEVNQESMRCKLATLPPTVGKKIVIEAIRLYAILRAPTTPAWAKTSIILALAYFLCPIDSMPDILPWGLVDDLAVATLTLARVRAFETEAVEKRVKKLERRWTPDWWKP